jgi:hypothetical protein
MPSANLLTIGQAVSTSLQNSIAEMIGNKRLVDKLDSAVTRHHNASIEKYDALSNCDSTCMDLIQPLITELSPQLQAMRIELSLMQPDDLKPAAIARTEAWFGMIPRQPFSKSPALQMLNANERTILREAFVRRLAQRVPAVAARADAIISKSEPPFTSSAEALVVNNAMIDIQRDARKKYLKIIGENPLLIFISDARLPLSPQDISEAAKQLRDHISEEKIRLIQISDPAEKSEALIEYRAAANSVLKDEPGLCSLANALNARSEASRARRALAHAAGQIAAGFAAFGLCSGIVTCGLAAAALSAVDYGIARDDAKEAFRTGVSKASRSDNGRDRFAADAMTTADSAAQMQYATLALAAPTFVKSGAEVVKLTTGMIRSTLSKAAPAMVTKGRYLNEMVGGPAPSRLNLVSQSYFKEVLEPHTGREREIIEVLIERMQAKGIEPSKISRHIEDRLRTCVF